MHDSLEGLQVLINSSLDCIENQMYALSLLQDIQIQNSALSTALNFISTTLKGDLSVILASTLLVSKDMMTDIWQTWDGLSSAVSLMANPASGIWCRVSVAFSPEEIEFPDVVEELPTINRQKRTK